MSRKAIPDSVQTSILLKSRRRCCICFWLQGLDELKKGQIAHLDQNHENADEDNLVFLCLEHHDEYDGKTSVSKGLRESEVRRWRDELYREMEYRFRTVKRHGFELRFVGVVWRGSKDAVAARFKLKNTGESAVKHPTVSMRLPDGIGGKMPKSRRVESTNMFIVEMPDLELWGMEESRQDLFEEGGRVGVKQVVGGINPQLLSGHSEEFDGLSIPLEQYPPGTDFEMEFRVDSDDTPPVYGRVTVSIPTDPEALIVEE
ncbi:MAG: hypothetical protein KDB01_02060 [Planctomycetaceae bacterium]|nr:hypothetical protein [Planctomycetaceae bacterium]